MNRQSCPACQRHRLNGFVSRPAAATRSSLRLLRIVPRCAGPVNQGREEEEEARLRTAEHLEMLMKATNDVRGRARCLGDWQVDADGYSHPVPPCRTPRPCSVSAAMAKASWSAPGVMGPVRQVGGACMTPPLDAHGRSLRLSQCQTRPCQVS